MSKISYVVDATGRPLAPTKEVKAWFMIRKGKATLVSKYPMTIQLFRKIPKEEICNDEVRLGIDAGSLYTGIAIVQKCKKYNKVLLKGTIEHRKNISKLMIERAGYRKNRKKNKRYRKQRFSNRTSHKRSNLVPSIKSNKDEIIRTINNINKFISIDNYYLEDVSIDIRALQDGYKSYKWQYQKSNRLDENIRKSIIIRDNNTCRMCGKKKGNMEVHHILPKRLNGTDSISNLITLCHKCHKKVTNNETKYINYFHKILNNENNNIGHNLKYASHVMIGKRYLRNILKSKGDVYLTTGGDTANKRNDWGMEKSHSNDAICITNLKPNEKYLGIKDWIIKPIRKKDSKKKKYSGVLGFRHRDYISYTYKDGNTYEGYITGLYPDLKALNFKAKEKHCKKVNAKKCKLLWRFNNLYWI